MMRHHAVMWGRHNQRVRMMCLRQRPAHLFIEGDVEGLKAGDEHHAARPLAPHEHAPRQTCLPCLCLVLCACTYASELCAEILSRLGCGSALRTCIRPALMNPGSMHLSKVVRREWSGGVESLALSWHRPCLAGIQPHPLCIGSCVRAQLVNRNTGGCEVWFASRLPRKLLLVPCALNHASVLFAHMLIII